MYSGMNASRACKRPALPAQSGRRDGAAEGDQVEAGLSRIGHKLQLGYLAELHDAASADQYIHHVIVLLYALRAAESGEISKKAFALGDEFVAATGSRSAADLCVYIGDLVGESVGLGHHVRQTVVYLHAQAVQPMPAIRDRLRRQLGGLHDLFAGGGPARVQAQGAPGIEHLLQPRCQAAADDVAEDVLHLVERGRERPVLPEPPALVGQLRAQELVLEPLDVHHPDAAARLAGHRAGYRSQDRPLPHIPGRRHVGGVVPDHLQSGAVGQERGLGYLQQAQWHRYQAERGVAAEGASL